MKTKILNIFILKHILTNFFNPTMLNDHLSVQIDASRPISLSPLSFHPLILTWH